MLERVCARDPEAMEAFFEHYFDWLYGLVHWLVADRTQAEDVTQDVLLKLQQNLHRLDPSRDPAPWIYVIAYNTCRDVWRSSAWRAARRSIPVGMGEGALDLVAPVAEAGADLDRARRDARVHAAVRELPEPLRTVVVLHQFEGLDHRAIAGVVGANHAAVRKRYSRALVALADLLKGMPS